MQLERTVTALREPEMKEVDLKLFYLAVRAFYKTFTDKLVY